MDLLTQICIYGFVVVVSLRMTIYNCINSLYKQFIYIYTCIHAYIHKHVFAGVSRSHPHFKRSGWVPLWHFAQGNCMVHPSFTDAPSCPSIKLSSCSYCSFCPKNIPILHTEKSIIFFSLQSSQNARS